MKNPFDYVYYSLSRYYLNNGEKNGGRFSGLVLLVFLQSLNIYSLLGIFNLTKIWSPAAIVLITCISLFVINGIRYNQLSFDILNAKWENNTEETKKRKRRNVGLYVAFTFLLLIVAIIV